MTSFEEEYNKRLRRVAGVTDDTYSVEVNMEVTEGGWTGGCETCEWYEEGKAFVVVRVYSVEAYSTIASVEFDDMGELIRALDAVEL